MVTVTPGILNAAAEDMARIGTTLQGANAAALPPTTALLPAGADEVSAAITALLNAHGAQYQELASQAQALHQQFVQNLTAASSAYQQTELGNLQALRTGVGQLEQPLVPLLEQAGFEPTPPIPPVPTNLNPIGLVMGGTTGPVIPQALASRIGTMYGITNPVRLYTPEQFWPLTPQLGNLTFGQSVAQGTQALDNALQTQIGLGHNVTAWGDSQSSVLITDEIRNLMAQGSPGQGLLKFVLTGNPNNPNGGLLERLNGAYIPGLDVLFNGATPPNSPYPTAIYTTQYDAVADFPRYVRNPVSDLNALAGLLFGNHGSYIAPGYTSVAQLLPTSPGYTGNTSYYMHLSQDLPLLTPLRMVGGNPLADLLQPDLRVLADMGYGSGEYPDIPTTASLSESPNPVTIGQDLLAGTIQGPQAALVDLGLLPQSYYPMGSYPFSPVLDPGLNYPLPQTGSTDLSVGRV